MKLVADFAKQVVIIHHQPTFSGLGPNFLVILLEGSKILTSLTEFTFFHTLSNIPVNKGTLGVHKIELVIDTRQGLGNGSGVGNHANGTLDTGKISSRHNGGRLVVNTTLETGGAPVHKLDGPFGFDGGNGSVDILGHNISTVHETAGHVLSMTRITLGHHTSRLKDGVGNFGNRELLVVSLLGRDHGCVRGKHEMDTRVGHQVGLELSYIHVQGTIETKRGRQGGDYLSNQPVEVGVGGALNV
jgi:hypothetical protein